MYRGWGQTDWGKEHSKGNKTVPAKVATTCTEDGDKQTEAKNTVKEIKQYQQKWLQCVQRMGTNRLGQRTQ